MKAFIFFYLLSLPCLGQIEIINDSGYPVQETILKTCQILNIDNVLITVKTADIKAFPASRYVLSAEYQSLVIQEMPGIYSIYLCPGLSPGSLTKILIHELAHVKQFHCGDLKYITKTEMEYKGEIIDLKRVDYDFRRFEYDADKTAKLIYRELKKGF